MKIVYNTDTRFGSSANFINDVESICQNKIIHEIKNAEPIGPKQLLDLLIIAPCTGNTLGKLANGITDTCVTMAAKATARRGKPVVLALASNDALGANLQNIGILYNKKSVYFVPLSQDDTYSKPYSLVCDFSLVEKTVESALKGEQIQPFLK